MNELEVTWGRALRVWWSIMWRALLFCFIAGFIAGFIVGFIGGMSGLDPKSIQLYAGIAGAAVGIPIGIWVVKTVLGKKYSEFRIALVAGG